MRHGRKSCRGRSDGFQRRVLHDRDSGLIRAVGLTAANAPEADVTAALESDLPTQHLSVGDRGELQLDWASLSSRWVCTARCFPKTACVLDGEQQTIQCPHQVRLSSAPGGTVHYPAALCAVCPLRQHCTTSALGRSGVRWGGPSGVSGRRSNTLRRI